MSDNKSKKGSKNGIRQNFPPFVLHLLGRTKPAMPSTTNCSHEIIFKRHNVVCLDNRKGDQVHFIALSLSPRTRVQRAGQG